VPSDTSGAGVTFGGSVGVSGVAGLVGAVGEPSTIVFADEPPPPQALNTAATNMVPISLDSFTMNSLSMN
jgi:hypothetical protein